MESQNEKEALDALVGLTEMIQEQSYASMASFFNDLYIAFSKNFEKEVRPESIESSYSGIHLNKTYEEGDFLRMIESFRNGKIIHAKYALQIIEDALKIYQTLPNISECNLKKCKTPMPGVIVVGDLHGSFKDLYYIMSQYGIPGKSYRFVFNGDFVDRGPQQSECLLTLLYAFLMFPTRVYLNRGNHEDLSLNLNNHFNPNFKKDVDDKFGRYGLAVFNQAQRLFRRLPLATIVENYSGFRVFITHGGLSNRLDLNYVSSTELNRFQFASISIDRKADKATRTMAEQLSDLLWSDPSPNNGCKPNDHRGIGFLFGPDVTDNFCRRYGFNCVIRSHEVRQNAYSQDHTRCFTIFSSSRYCGGNNRAGVLIIDANRLDISKNTFEIMSLDIDEFEKDKRLVIQNLNVYLEKEAMNLLPLFQNVDSNKSGSIGINKWAEILSKFFHEKHNILVEPKHFVTLKDYLCPCNDQTYTAEYSLMFKSVRNDYSNRIFDFLESLFGLIDLDKNGFISKTEARKAVSVLNKTLGTSYSSAFIDIMDENQDGFVDINEFKNSFSKAFNL